MKKCLTAFMICMFFFLVFPIFAGEYYQKGSSMFSVKAGVSVPTFIKFFEKPDLDVLTFPKDMHVKVGGFAALSYQVFVTQKIEIGGELGYAFNYSQTKKIMTTVPISFKATFVPIQTGKFDMMLSANLGLTYNRYNKTRFMMPFACVSVNSSYYINENFGLGVEGGFWLNPEFHSKNILKKDNSLLGMMPITLALTYRK